ncbi:MAG: discoidin domain-containing protein [Promethearchaeota archaeon]
MADEESSRSRVFPGADEGTPSRSEYFTWINNTNEGPTEAQTMVNLDFFAWLGREFGVQLDIYAFDAGAVDAPRGYYGKLDSEKFRRQFPRGLKPVYERCKSIGCRLGLWGGPDGFGDTEEEARERIDLVVGLCRDYELALFKVDAVCGQLRPSKQDYFVEMLRECRKYSPDLILLNHRLDLGRGAPHATTTLLSGIETYIDVHLFNTFPATHHRAGSLSRPTPEDLSRLQEDHGVCLSSCLDFWEDDLVLQAFNRALICAPQLYGNPWFLRDDEYPRLARLFNLHRRYRGLLVSAVELPTDKYGPWALSRGDGRTRFVTLRNLEWEFSTYRIRLDGEVGLDGSHPGSDIRVVQLHPTERVLGHFHHGDTVEVVVHPFRACLLAVESSNAKVPLREVTLEGVDYRVVRDVEGQPVEVEVLGQPGGIATVRLVRGGRDFARAWLDGEELPALVLGEAVEVRFPGTPLGQPWHRKLGELREGKVPPDAEALYEATCFAATNKCLEVRCIDRSGPSAVPEVVAAREAFFNQPLFKVRGVWDWFAFDGDPGTRWYCPSYPEAALRVDLGGARRLDRVLLKGAGDDFEEPPGTRLTLETSPDLSTWTMHEAPLRECPPAGTSNEDPHHCAVPESTDLPFDPRDDPRFFGESRFPFPVGEQRFVEFDLSGELVRYLRFHQAPMHAFEVAASEGGRWIEERGNWRGNYLFERLQCTPVERAWSTKFTLEEVPPGSYLCVAVFGNHGEEGAYAAVKVGGTYVGAPDRAPSYPGYPWEANIHSTTGNYTYYFPLDASAVGREVEAYVLSLAGNPSDFWAEVWITAYPEPLARRSLVLE